MQVGVNSQLNFVFFIPYVYIIVRTRSDFEKHFTIKNCDKTFLKIILRLKIAKKRRRFDVSWMSLSSQNKLVIFGL